MTTPKTISDKPKPKDGRVSPTVHRKALRFKKLFYISCAVIIVLLVILFWPKSRPKKQGLTLTPVELQQHIESVESLARAKDTVLVERQNIIKEKETIIRYNHEENRRLIDNYSGNEIERAFAELKE